MLEAELELERPEPADLSSPDQTDHHVNAWAPRSALVGPSVPRFAAWAVPASIAIGLLPLGQPLALAPLYLAMAATFAAILATPSVTGGMHARRQLTVVAALPAGLMLLVLVALTIGLMGGVADRSVWAGRGSAVAAVVVGVALAGAIAWRRGGRVVLVGQDWPALTGATALGAFFFWIIASQPFQVWSRSMSSGTDFLRHLGLVRDVRVAGRLEPGAITFPSGFHTPAAWLSAALGLETDAQTLWRAMQPVVLLFLVVMLLAVMAVAGRATDLAVEGRWTGVVAALVAGVTFVQTAWFSTFLALGSVMNMIVAVALLGMLLAALTLRSGSPTAALVAGGAVAVTANTWQLLLPVAGLGCLPWILAGLRRNWRDLRQWGMWLAMGLLSINGLLGLRGTSIVGTTSTPTVSNLFNPDWWWFAALVLSVSAAVAVFREGARTWAVSAAGMLLGVVGLTAYLLRVTGSTWELMLYYPVKALWTGIIVFIPLSAAGLVMAISVAWRRARRAGRLARLALRVGIVGVLALLVAGVAGRGAAFRPHLVVMAMGGSGIPNWSIAVIDATEDMPIPVESVEGAIAMGVVPSTNLGSITGGFIGMADYLAMESLSHLGIKGAAESPVKLDLAHRDSERICSYLKAYPQSLRLTGPNPAAGPGWLLDSGCPRSVVQPQRWISLQFDPAWLARSPWQDPHTWTYPTFAEFASATKSGKQH